ncbi:inositol 2-dehydrogenase [Sphingomonas sp. RB56-2]|uniref:Inositol 2-dehydrogenase n=1 Tax=Sphingomonas brevis TaxID=2908206 RepID=A0ABT0S8S8_9SPHN|nr:inositol 2-dehydrogenase [Sphingomonas brevis]MCL6740799.1 inositol 2-dehydrogenase [Sphingomonas brevis]
MKVHNVALVGAGRMGELHARNAASNPRFRLAAIADHNEQLASSVARETASAAASYGEILGDPNIDAVMVASSTSSHLENVLAALGAGKSVFCEKPLSLDAAALADALPGIEASSKPVFIAFNRRFDPHLRDLKSRLDGGLIGSLETIHIINHDPALPRLDFIPRSGGLFKDFTIHDFDTARWLIGEEFVELFAVGACLIDQEIAALGDIDTAKLILKSAGGTLCLISNSRRTGYGYDQRVELFGSKGALRVDNLPGTTVSKLDEAGGNGASFPFSFAERYAEAYRAELDHFADVLDGNAAPSTGPHDTLRALRLADAAERSFKSGTRIRLEGVMGDA